MALPQLIAEDVQELDRLLGELVSRSEATAAIIIDKGGFLINQAGEFDQFDSTTLARIGRWLIRRNAGNGFDCQRTQFQQRLSARGKPQPRRPEHRARYAAGRGIPHLRECRRGEIFRERHSAKNRRAVSMCAHSAIPIPRSISSVMNLENSSDFFRKVAGTA
jgi:hypothetical protein